MNGKEEGLEAANSKQLPSQVICTCSKIKDGHLEDVRHWLRTLIDRKEETLASFRNEGVSLESAFIMQSQEGDFLIYYMRAQDVTQAMAIFQASSLAIDHFHKQCWEQYTEQHQVLAEVFHLESLLN